MFHSVARWYYSSHACSNTSVSGNGARPALPHFIVSNLEHDSVTSAVSHMQQQGLIGWYFIPVCSVSVLLRILISIPCSESNFAVAFVNGFWDISQLLVSFSQFNVVL